MQSLRSLVRQLEPLYAEIDQAVALYAQRSALACPPGCGVCCHSPNIEVTLLDALPLACSLVDEGEGETLLRALEDHPQPHCPLFLHHGAGQGRCRRYAHRPSLCRLFGFAGRPNKHGLVTLAVCRVHKEKQTPIPTHPAPPSFTAFGHRLAAIHPAYGTTLLPIHEALRQALEKVLLARQLHP